MQAKIEKLQMQADALAAKKSSAVIGKIRELMAEHGLTTADVDAHAGATKGGRKQGAKAAPKSSASTARYRDPRTGATWSGHGRAPGWIASAQDRSKYLVVDNAVMGSAPAAKKPAKAGNYVRGHSRRFIVTLSLARRGAGVVGPRRGWQVPRTERSS